MRPGASCGTGPTGRVAELSMQTPSVLRLGFSPCPNDTFIFHALVSGLVDTGGLRYRERLEDVETLNRLALEGQLDVTKISFHALGRIRDRYILLRSGAALGRGCGPLLISKKGGPSANLRGRPVAIPGAWTTALLLLRLYDEKLACKTVEMPFHEIPGAVASGRVAAGLIIHESRFTYEGLGLRANVDLGAWWEEETGLPIPLGGIVARRDLGIDRITAVDRALRASVLHAATHPADSRNYVRRHAQEMRDEVLRQHIELYVNDFSVDLGREGEKAVAALMKRSVEAGLLPGESGLDGLLAPGQSGSTE